MSVKRYCDHHECGELIARDGTHGKLKRAPGSMHGRDLDLCDVHGLQFERWLTGKPDEDRGNTAKARTRRPKPTAPTTEARR